MNLDMLRRAAAEYFEEGFVLAEARRIIEGTDPELRVAAWESLAPRRTLPDGCFLWVGYLIWLERVLEIASVPLTASETQGLMVLRQERTRFENQHPPCPKCGMPNELHALVCRDCMQEIPR